MSQWRETLTGMAFPNYCDHMGHANNRWYAHLFDAASRSLWSQIGLSERALRERYETSVSLILLLRPRPFRGLITTSGGERCRRAP
jgi:hypothetical protein